MRVHKGAMSLELCAARMTALLERKPRAKKTRKYVDSLPKRAKIVVRPEDFIGPPPRVVRWEAEPIRAVVVARSADGKEVGRFVRKDRMRPRPRQGEMDLDTPTCARIAGPWHCRPNGRHVRPWTNSAEKMIRSAAVTVRQRFLLYVAQDGHCGLCGESMNGAPFEFSLDHVIPRSLDGADGLGNLLLCHGECNGRKTNDVPTGCEMVWLLNVNARLGFLPVVF